MKIHIYPKIINNTSERSFYKVPTNCSYTYEYDKPHKICTDNKVNQNIKTNSEDKGTTIRINKVNKNLHTKTSEVNDNNLIELRED